MMKYLKEKLCNIKHIFTRYIVRLARVEEKKN